MFSFSFSTLRSFISQNGLSCSLITYIFEMRSNYLCSCKVSVIMEVRTADAYIQTPALKFSAPGIHHTGGVLEIYRNIYHITGFLTHRNRYEPSKTALLNFFCPLPLLFPNSKNLCPLLFRFPPKKSVPPPPNFVLKM